VFAGKGGKGSAVPRSSGPYRQRKKHECGGGKKEGEPESRLAELFDALRREEKDKESGGKLDGQQRPNDARKSADWGNSLMPRSEKTRAVLAEILKRRPEGQ